MSNGYAPVLIHRQNDTPRENNAMTWILLAICLSGAASIYLFNNQKESLRENVVVVSQANSPQPVLAAASIVPKAEAAAPLRPDGHYLGLNVEVAEALQPTEFAFTPYMGSDFIIDYGDGTEERVHGLKATHTYLTDGTKVVVLKTCFNGQAEVLQTKKIEVAPAIEVDISTQVVDR